MNSKAIAATGTPATIIYFSCSAGLRLGRVACWLSPVEVAVDEAVGFAFSMVDDGERDVTGELSSGVCWMMPHEVAFKK